MNLLKQLQQGIARKKRNAIAFLFVCLVGMWGCLGIEQTFLAPVPQVTDVPTPMLTRNEAIPADSVKYGPENDPHPPIFHSSAWEFPVPVAGFVNTAGAEDSPYVTPDGMRLFFFFTPDASVPAERQVVDGVTGIYVSDWDGAAWGEARRVLLVSGMNAFAMDGCPTMVGDELWFCSIREGNFGEIDFWTAKETSGGWTHFMNAGAYLNEEIVIGEMHIWEVGEKLAYHSHGSVEGDVDLFMIEKDSSGEWGQPFPLDVFNTPESVEGWPFVTEDGGEFWFLRMYLGTPGIFRSVRGADGEWGEAELIVSQFAGEPTLDTAGNLYFVHHFVQDGVILEADIYFSRKK